MFTVEVIQKIGFRALGVFQKNSRMGTKFASCLEGCIIQNEIGKNCLRHLLEGIGTAGATVQFLKIERVFEV